MDTMETILTIILVIVMFYQLYKSSQQSLQDKQQEDEKITAILIKVEKYEDQIYFWDRDTGDFIIQGRDMNEIVDKCAKYFPQRNFCIEQEDVEKYDLKLKETPV